MSFSDQTQRLQPHEMPQVKDVLERLMTWPESRTEESHDPDLRALVERYLFIPGEETLARSDAESGPMDMKQMEVLAKGNHSDVWKRSGGNLSSKIAYEIRENIFDHLFAFMNIYNNDPAHRHRIAELSFIKLSGWAGEEQGSKVYLQLTVKEKHDEDIDMGQIKELADDAVKVVNAHMRSEMVDALQEKYGVPDIPCIVIVDTYRLH